MSSLIEILNEQDAIAFTGRISIYGSQNSEYLGYLLIKDGIVILVNFDQLRDLEALCKITRLEILDSKTFRFETNPENVESFNKRIYFSYQEIKKIAEKDLDDISKVRKLRPPMNLELQVVNSFIKKGENISKAEFEVLCLINMNGSISTLYKNTTAIIDEDNLTKALIHLRKLKAIKVIGTI